MRPILRRIYNFLTAPLYRRISSDVTLELQRLNRANLDQQEKLTQLVIDELVRFSFELENKSSADSQSTVVSFRPEFNNSGAAKHLSHHEIIELVQKIDSSGGIIDAGVKYGISISALLKIHEKYAGMDERGINRVDELERQNAELRQALADLINEKCETLIAERNTTVKKV